MSKIVLVFSMFVFVIQTSAQNVGVNSTGAVPHASAMLDVVSANKGLLVPRVNIANLATAAPITAPALSLLVYNTNATTGEGYYFWDGVSWVKISDANSNSDYDWYEVGGTSSPNAIGDNIFTQGNVGIGVNNPLSTLHVVGSARISSLAGVGIRMVTADANGILGVQAITVGDITGVTAGTGLTGGGTTGTVTVNAVGLNGLTTAANDIRLGGALVQNTTITNGNLHMIYNLNGTGDFLIRDAGITHFAVTDNGNSTFGGDVFWRDESTGGTILGSIIDDGNDGRFRIRENGVVSVDFDANTQFILNEQGLDRNTRIESNANANMFLVDAGTDRVSIGSATTDGVSDAEFNVTGNSSFSDDIRLKDGNTNTGDVLVRLYDSNDDGVVEVMQNGIVNHTIHGNGNTIFNEQGLNFDFKVEGNTDQNLLFVDGSANNVGIGTIAPSTKLHVNGDFRLVDGTQGVNKTLVSDANGNASWQQASASVVTGAVNLSTIALPTPTTKVYQGSSVTVSPGTWIIRPYGFFNASAGSSAVQWFLSRSATVYTAVGGSGIASAPISQHTSLCYNNAEFKAVTVTTPTTFYLWGQIQAGTGTMVMNVNEGNLTAWKIN